MTSNEIAKLLKIENKIWFKLGHVVAEEISLIQIARNNCTNARTDTAFLISKILNQHREKR